MLSDAYAYGILLMFYFEHRRKPGVNARVVYLKCVSSPTLKAQTRGDSLEIKLIKGPVMCLRAVPPGDEFGCYSKHHYLTQIYGPRD
jgi:hypothetical protein